MVVQDLRPPALEGVTERDDLGDVVVEAAGDRLLEQDGRHLDLVCEVDIPHPLFGEPCPEVLVFRVTETKAEKESLVALLVEAFGTGDEELSDPVERIVLSSAMPGRLVLHSSSDDVDTSFVLNKERAGGRTRSVWQT